MKARRLWPYAFTVLAGAALGVIAWYVGWGARSVPVVVTVEETGYDWAELSWEGSADAWRVRVLWSDPPELIRDWGIPRGMAPARWPDAIQLRVSERGGEVLGDLFSVVIHEGTCAEPVVRAGVGGLWQCRAEALPDSDLWAFTAIPLVDVVRRYASRRE